MLFFSRVPSTFLFQTYTSACARKSRQSSHRSLPSFSFSSKLPASALVASNSYFLKNRVKTKLYFHTVSFRMHSVYHFYLVYQPDFAIMSQLQKNPYFSTETNLPSQYT